jgi:hypothetical protein
MLVVVVVVVVLLLLLLLLLLWLTLFLFITIRFGLEGYHGIGPLVSWGPSSLQWEIKNSFSQSHSPRHHHDQHHQGHKMGMVNFMISQLLLYDYFLMPCHLILLNNLIVVLSNFKSMIVFCMYLQRTILTFSQELYHLLFFVNSA